jgi:hypothetical protein
MKRLAYILLILLVPALAYAYVVGTPSNMVPGNWQAYAVDPGASDSGVTSTSQVTLKNLVTAIGTTKKSTIVFPHTGSGTTTQYTIGTALDLSSYSNITFQFENGAQLKVSAGVSGVTLPSPANISAQPNQQIMSGTSLYFSSPGTVYPEWWGIDGTADDVQIQAALNSCIGGVIKLQPTSYSLESGVTIDRDNQTLMCDVHRGATLTTANDIDTINISASCYMKNLYITTSNAGPTKAGLRILTSVRSYFENIRIDYYYYGLNCVSNTSGIMYNAFIHCAFLFNDYSVHFATGETINENNWIDCDFRGSTENHLYLENTTSNNNKFIACSFQQWGYPALGAGKWAIKDAGTANVYDSCRFENTVAQSCGIYLSGSNSDIMHPPRLSNLYFSGVAAAKIAVVSGNISIQNDRNIGIIFGGYETATTVDSDSAAGSTSINIAVTTLFNENDTIVIGLGTAREEFSQVSRITSGASLVLTSNLIYDHTAADADQVKTVGLMSGFNLFPIGTTGGYSYSDIMSYGHRVLRLSGTQAIVKAGTTLYMDTLAGSGVSNVLWQQGSNIYLTTPSGVTGISIGAQGVRVFDTSGSTKLSN